MSVEQSPQFGPLDHRSEAEIHPMQPLPNAGDWSHRQESSGQSRREVPPLRPHARSPRPRRRWIWQALMLLLAIVLGTGGMLFYLDQTFAGLIYPNLSIRGVAVGEMTPEEAKDTLRSRYAAFLQQPLTLTYNDQTWTPSLDDLGIHLEIDESVAQAYGAGRNHGLISNLREVAAVWQSGLELPLRVTVDQTVMQNYLFARAAEIDKPSTDAQLLIQDGRLGMISAIVGRQVLINETLLDITAALQTLESQTVAVRTRELQPMLNDVDVIAAQNITTPILQGPLLIEADGKIWQWSLNELAELVQVRREPKESGLGDQLVVTVDREQVRERIKEIADATEQKGAYPRVDWNGGDLKIIGPGEPGSRVDEEKAEKLILAALDSSDRSVTLPFQTLDTKVTAANLDQLGIKELIAVGRSDFSGSAAYRITNIQAGMRLLHGILLAPDEEFSFNDNIGSIDASNGFVEGYAIIQNRTQLEWGGGICQDSTTMFRAAFWAGLPITERWGHSFYINWYDKYGYGRYGDGPGMDATIFTGGPDLKFVNDTGHWLLIQTYVDTRLTVAEVRIYGADPGRIVQLEGPVISNRQPAPPTPVFVSDPGQPRGAIRQSDKARGGMDITYTRIIKERGSVVSRDTFVTRFRPWPNIFVANPADLGEDGKPRPPEETTQENPDDLSVADGAAPPADGTQPPTDGAQPPAEQSPPVGGTQPPAEQSPPFGGAQPPIDPNQPPPAEEQPPTSNG
ncbi:MAG: VanW family protein [Chloroflexales bacterium]|nr:VanW family protein [Chloroflexales bacterium]